MRRDAAMKSLVESSFLFQNDRAIKVQQRNPNGVLLMFHSLSCLGENVEGLERLPILVGSNAEPYHCLGRLIAHVHTFEGVESLLRQLRSLSIQVQVQIHFCLVEIAESAHIVIGNTLAILTGLLI